MANNHSLEFIELFMIKYSVSLLSEEPESFVFGNVWLKVTIGLCLDCDVELLLNVNPPKEQKIILKYLTIINKDKIVEACITCASINSSQNDSTVILGYKVQNAFWKWVRHPKKKKKPSIWSQKLHIEWHFLKENQMRNADSTS